jgi:hypothetical protein
MTKKAQFTLNVWERKFLRKVYGLVIEDGVWRIESNQELEEFYKTSDLISCDYHKEKL